MTDPTPSTLARAFRRAAVPLCWYYAVTLGLPLANGAAQSGAAFVNHAVVVLVVPLVLILLVFGLQKSAQVLFVPQRLRRIHSRCAPGRTR